MIDYALLAVTFAVLLAGVAWACLSANPHKRREDEREETGGDVEAEADRSPPAPSESWTPIDSSRWPATSEARRPRDE